MENWNWPPDSRLWVRTPAQMSGQVRAGLGSAVCQICQNGSRVDRCRAHWRPRPGEDLLLSDFDVRAPPETVEPMLPGFGHLLHVDTLVDGLTGLDIGRE